MITVKTLVAGSQLTGTAATYYTAPANTKAIIHNMSLANTGTSAVTATIHLVDTGATETTSNMSIVARVIAPNETYRCPEVVGKTISATGTIRALASIGTAISIQAHGVEVT